MLDTHARHVVQPYIEKTAIQLTRVNLTPTQVTWIAFIFGVSSGLFTYLGYPLVAVAMLWLSGYLDAVDGTMARLQKRTSAWGTLLDITFDRLVELSIIISLAILYPHAQFILLLLACLIVFAITVFLTVGALSEKRGMKSFYYQAGLAERTEGFILFTLMIMFPAWLVWLTGVFLFVELFTTFQRLAEARRLLKEVP